MENVEKETIDVEAKYLLELQDYEKFVELFANGSDSITFPNSSPGHANVVMSKILKFSNEEVRIYDDNLKGDIADLREEFQENLLEFINDDNKKIKIIIKDSKTYTSKICEFLKGNAKKENINIFLASQEFKESVNNILGCDISFMCGDNRFLRIQENKDENNIVKKTALCYFNQPRINNHFSKIFDSNLETCKAFNFE